MRRRNAVVVFAAAACLLASCSGGASKSATGGTVGTSTSSTTTSTVAGSSTSASTTAPGPGPTATNPPTTSKPITPTTRAISRGLIAITNDNNGDVVSVAVGQQVEVTLSTTGTQWSPPSQTPEGLLRTDPSPAPPPNGVLVIWTATGAGTVKVQSGGRAICSAGQVCPLFIQAFTVTLAIAA